MIWVFQFEKEILGYIFILINAFPFIIVFSQISSERVLGESSLATSYLQKFNCSLSPGQENFKSLNSHWRFSTISSQSSLWVLPPTAIFYKPYIRAKYWSVHALNSSDSLPYLCCFLSSFQISINHILNFPYKYTY